MKILFLYRELAGYIVNCMNVLAERYEARVDVVAYPIHPDAPFNFEFHHNVRLTDRTSQSTSDLISLVGTGEYNLVVCSGWSDAGYLSAIRKNPGVNAAVAFDKQWFGSMRDWLATTYLRLRVAPMFRHAFVAGHEQHQFARKMGFVHDSIFEGVYACDNRIFNRVYLSRQATVPERTVRKMWYAGRYVPEKAVLEMCEAIIPLLDGDLQDWELHCIGTGPLWDERPAHPRIHHHGFVQPEAMSTLISDGEIFLMPSRFEPWCLAVQEFATAGYALLLSDKVGARWSFLRPGENGDVFESDNWSNFSQRLINLCRHPPEELREMGRRSHELAEMVSPEGWCKSINAMAGS